MHFYEDHPSKTIHDNHALLQCKKFRWPNLPLLKPFVLTQTTTSMIFYLENVVAESYKWMNWSQCYMSNTGIAIHNFLFYNGDTKPNIVHEHRRDIVNSVGMIARYYKENYHHTSQQHQHQQLRDEHDDSNSSWEELSKMLREYKQMDENGYFLNADGSTSTIIHQFHDFGIPFYKWLAKQPFMVDDDDKDNDNDGDSNKIGDGGDLKRKTPLNIIDNPIDNPLYYFLLESLATMTSDESSKGFLRKRNVYGKVVHHDG